MTIKIPVSADLNTGDIEKKLQAMRDTMNAMGREAEKNGKVRFEPISKVTVQEMRNANKEFERMLQLSGGLRKRLGDAGQGGKNWDQINWQAAFPDANQRQTYMHTLLNRLSPGSVGFLPEALKPKPGAPGAPGVAPGAQPHRPARPGDGSAAGAGLQVVNAGLGAVGPAGSVASGALRTGMSAGFGAGMMGLLGGMAALGVGKLVGAAVENLDKAQDNEVGYDRLKRTIGDVNVSFGALREVVKATAGDTKTTFDEATALAGQYAKAANVSGDAMQLRSGVGFGVGLSRAYGLDPGLGVGVMGQIRGTGVARNEQETRKFGLLIGETIAKSRSFAKADEVIQSLAGYAITQSRASLSSNAQGYAGAFTGLLNTKLPGMDATNATNILGRVNAAIAGGGAYGEASQFFTARMGAGMGLNPLQTKLLTEGGAFNTLDQTFGSGTIASRFGIKGPGGNKTVLEAQMDQLRRDYGGQDPLYLLEAAKNHFGLQSMAQAGALMSMKPGDMGQLSKFAKGRNLSGEGIGNLAMTMFGSDADRESIYRDLMGRTGGDALSDAERARLEKARAGGGEDFKQTLADLAASRGQESTQGKDIRDSRALLDNIKTDIASKLIPAVQSMRDGIIFMAGKGSMTAREISKKVAEAEYNERAGRVKADYDKRIGEQSAIIDGAQAPLGTGVDGMSLLSEEEQKRVLAAHAERQRLYRERREKLGGIDDEQKKRLSEIDVAADAAAKVEEAQKAGQNANTNPGFVAGVSALAGNERTEQVLGALFQQESRGRHRDARGNLITSPVGAAGISQVMPRTGADPGYGVRPLQNDSEEEYRRFGRDYYNAMLREFGGDEQKALAAYNAGPGRVQNAVRAHGGNWLRHMPRETQNYVPGVLNRLPEGHREPQNHGQSVTVQVDPIQVQHQNERGQQVRPTETLSTRVQPARPFGS